MLFSRARHTSTYTDLRVLAADATAQSEPVTSKTVSTSLDPLLRLWVVDEQLAWGGHLRSAAQVRLKAKRHLIDPSLAGAALGADPGALLADRELFGFAFEGLYRDLCVYTHALGGTDSLLDLAAKALLRFGDNMKLPPAGPGIVVATGPSYQRTDGCM